MTRGARPVQRGRARLQLTAASCFSFVSASGRSAAALVTGTVRAAIVAGLGAWLIAGCAGSATRGAAPTEKPAAAASAEPTDTARVRQLAPDYLARAERAELRAQAEHDAAAARAERACASLLFGAARAEADRVELERRLLDAALELDGLSRARAAELRATRELEAAERRELARRRAEARAAELQPKARFADPQPTAAFLLERARATLAAARALGAEPGALERVERSIALAARGQLRPSDVLDQAERLLPRAH